MKNLLFVTIILALISANDAFDGFGEIDKYVEEAKDFTEKNAEPLNNMKSKYAQRAFSTLPLLGSARTTPKKSYLNCLNNSCQPTLTDKIVEMINKFVDTVSRIISVILDYIFKNFGNFLNITNLKRLIKNNAPSVVSNMLGI